MISVTILGNNSAIPAHDRHPTSQVVTIEDQLLLLDCGEGTQMQMARFRIKRSKIKHIFISHLHGDHYFGLIGFINSLGLMGRVQPLHLWAPEPLENIIALQLKAATTQLPFELIFHPLPEAGLLVVEDKFEVSCFPTQHRIPCWGFVVKRVHRLRRLDKEKALDYEIPAAYYEKLKLGEDYIRKDGLLVKNEWVTIDPLPSKIYAYCADTRYDESIIPFIKGANLLYHESTYLNGQETKALERYHSTAAQAATIASLAEAKQLLLGHYSAKYEDIQPFELEARQIFPNSFISIEGQTYVIE